MLSLRKPPADCLHILQKAWQKWQQAASNYPNNKHKIPRKQAMSMRDILPIIPYLGLFEHHAFGSSTYKVVGEQLEIFFKNKVIGEKLQDKTSVQHAQLNFHNHISQAVCKKPQGFFLRRSVPTAAETLWHYESLVLPMTNKDDDICYGLLAGKLSPPACSQSNVWKNLITFDFSDTRITHFQPIDLGYGVTDITDHVPTEVTAMPTIPLSQFV